VIIFDGLRPEFVTEAYMPNLYALKNRGAYAAENHSVFPTVTRVNSSSFATGSYPKTHGILGNSIHLPTLRNQRVYNTGNREDLLQIDSLTGGNLLTTVSTGEVLARNGKALYVFSSGSTGQAYLQNHQVQGAIIHPEYILPEAFVEEVEAAVGKSPVQQIAENTPGQIPASSGATVSESDRYAKHRWVTDAFLHFGLAEDGPAVSTVWYSEPDAAQHGTGIGSPRSLEAIAVMDAQLGRILEAIEERGIGESFNIIVTADHGFISYQGEETLVDFLIREGFKKDRESTDIVVADGAVFLKDRQPGLLEAIVEKLQHQAWVGPLFTPAATGPDAVAGHGQIEGTLSFDLIHWHHADRAADLLVTYHWSDETNEFGYPGIQHSRSRIAAGHGGISAHEMRTPLVFWGPDFKAAHESALPTSFIDIMPTVLAIQGIDKPAEMDGRVLREFFKSSNNSNNTELPSVHRETISNQVDSPSGTYEIQVRISTVDGYRYLDYGKALR